MSATLTIPKFSVNLIATRDPQEVYEELINKGTIPIDELLTYGFVNTPITRNDTQEIVAHVTIWENRDVTVVRDADGALLGVRQEIGYLTTEQALALFVEVWEANEVTR